MNKKIYSKPLIQWPSGDHKTLLLININIEEFSKEFTLPYIVHQDDLGSYSSTVFNLEGIGSVVLVKRDADENVEVVVDKEINECEAIGLLLHAMSLNSDSVIWRVDQ